MNMPSAKTRINPMINDLGALPIFFKRNLLCDIIFSLFRSIYLSYWSDYPTVLSCDIDFASTVSNTYKYEDN